MKRVYNLNNKVIVQSDPNQLKEGQVLFVNNPNTGSVSLLERINGNLSDISNSDLLADWKAASIRSAMKSSMETALQYTLGIKPSVTVNPTASKWQKRRLSKGMQYMCNYTYTFPEDNDQNNSVAYNIDFSKTTMLLPEYSVYPKNGAQMICSVDFDGNTNIFSLTAYSAVSAYESGNVKQVNISVSIMTSLDQTDLLDDLDKLLL